FPRAAPSHPPPGRHRPAASGLALGRDPAASLASAGPAPDTIRTRAALRNGGIWMDKLPVVARSRAPPRATPTSVGGATTPPFPGDDFAQEEDREDYRSWRASRRQRALQPHRRPLVHRRRAHH